ncbi:hypothetical protein ES703_78950 [subsurface metagenome]
MILTKTEADLRKIIAEAAQAGDYRTVDMGRAAAVSIHNLQLQISKTSGKVSEKHGHGAARTKSKVASRKNVKRKYPKFAVKNDTLIRIGWSKKEHCEYTHKTPRTAFDGTVKVMAALAQNGAGPFTAEQIIEQVNNMESEAVPSYQVYVVIGLLRKSNCIKQVGREGYDIPVEVCGKAEDVWRSRTGGEV